MEGFIRGFFSQVRGGGGGGDEDDNDYDGSRYKCAGRINNIGQKILAIAMSPDGRMCAYGGEYSAQLISKALLTKQLTDARQRTRRDPYSRRYRSPPRSSKILQHRRRRGYADCVV